MMERQVKVTVPLRIDIGGTWDLKAFALLLQSVSPCTVNAAIDLPVTVTLRRRGDDMIAIEDPYARVCVALEDADFRGPFGLLLAMCCQAQWVGISATIEYSVPPRSGLGGSGALASAFALAMERLFGLGLTRRRIAQMVHEVEEGLRFSYCGLQDQCAALHGGVNAWHWTYAHQSKYWRTALLSPSEYADFSDRLVVAYLGRGHSANVNQRQIDTLFDPATRKGWLEINRLTHFAAEWIRSRDWLSLAACIRRENEIRLSLVPERLAAEAVPLAANADKWGAAFGVAGAGAGGCVFAFLPDTRRLSELEGSWANALASVDGAMLFCRPGISEGPQIEVFADGREDSTDRRMDGRDRASVAV